MATKVGFAHIGAPAAFDHRNMKWSSYKVQFENFLTANGITDPAVSRSCLITLLGTQSYEILESLCFPDDPNSKTTAELLELMSQHFKPQRLKIAEQYRFWRIKQGTGQSIPDYVADIRKAASTCEFPVQYLQDALTTAFVLGLREENTVRKLLSEPTLTLDRAISVAQGMEMANRESSALGTMPPQPTINLVRGASGKSIVRQSRVSEPSKTQRKPCYRCGSTAHDHWECKFRNEACNACGKRGHIKAVCKNSQRANMGVCTRTTTQRLLNVSGELEQEEILTIRSAATDARYITVEINGNNQRLQLDTGCSPTIINWSTYRKIGSPQLLPTAVKLVSYSNDQVIVKGESLV